MLTACPQSNSCVRVVTLPGGIIGPFAGVCANGVAGNYSGDGGPASAARMCFPTALAVTAAGVFIVEGVS